MLIENPKLILQKMKEPDWFNTLLGTAIVPQVINLITQNTTMSDIDAIEAFYSSKTYELLSVAETDVWHFSPLTIFKIWETEQETGDLILPEEQ